MWTCRENQQKRGDKKERHDEQQRQKKSCKFVYVDEISPFVGIYWTACASPPNIKQKKQRIGGEHSTSSHRAILAYTWLFLVHANTKRCVAQLADVLLAGLTSQPNRKSDMNHFDVYIDRYKWSIHTSQMNSFMAMLCSSQLLQFQTALGRAQLWRESLFYWKQSSRSVQSFESEFTYNFDVFLTE